jgi:hypothetical protein
MAEAAVFISLSAGVDRSIQSMALAGLFQAANIGALTGLTASSSVLEIGLTDQLQRHLPAIPEKAEVCMQHNGAHQAMSQLTHIL